MLQRRYLSACLFVLLLPATCAADEPEQRAPADLVQDYVMATNERDVDQMMSMVTEDVQWISIAGDKLSVETDSRDKLRKSMESYFKSVPSAKSELQWTRTAGSRVTAMETASWESRSKTRAMSSLSVYEFKDGLIHRVYYFPGESPSSNSDEKE